MNTPLSRIFIALFFLFPFGKLSAWGFWAHKHINRMAVFTLPAELFGFYKTQIEYVTEHAIDPDKRRYAFEGEACRHYIDLDHYGAYPFQKLPRTWQAAQDYYTKDTLEAYGILPWHIQKAYLKLVKAYKSRHTSEILKLSADLGHYIADACVPLHTTENYNGQLTGQHGIHGLWESRLPELFGMQYDYYIKPASYIENVLNTAWQVILESHIAVDTVLMAEKTLTDEFSPDQKYSFENRNTILVKVYSEAFCKIYQQKLDRMIERRMRRAIHMVGSLWYSAWIDAGQPVMNNYSRTPLKVTSPVYEKKLKIQDREMQAPGSP